MEIALGALIIIVLLLPGVSFRKGYFSEEFSNQYTIKDFFQLFVNTFIPSIVIYLLALPLIMLLGYQYNFKILLGLISSNDDLLKNSITKIEYFKYEIIFFQLIINILAFFAGYKIKNIIVKNSFDTKIEFFRYKNIWHYVLSAKFAKFKRSQIAFNTDVEEIDMTYLDAIISIGDDTFLYNGLLVDYQLASDGRLDFLIIKEAQRKLIGKKKFKNIDGHIIVLKYENIINLNLTFIQAEEDSNGNVLLSYLN